MANTIDTRTIHDGNRNLVVEAFILGDASGEETATQLIDVSGYAGHGVDWDEVAVTKIVHSLTGFSVNLLWDATTDDEFAQISGDNAGTLDYSDVGGLINPGSTGFTGDIMFTTIGLGSGDKGNIVLHMRKRSG